MEAIAIGLEAIADWLEAIASRLEATVTRNKKLLPVLFIRGREDRRPNFLEPRPVSRHTAHLDLGCPTSKCVSVSAVVGCLESPTGQVYMKGDMSKQMSSSPNQDNRKEEVAHQKTGLILGCCSPLNSLKFFRVKNTELLC